MKKRFIALLLITLLLTGCGTAAKPQGIYYPPISHMFIGNTLLPNKYSSACYIDSSSLYYNDGVYTRVAKYMEHSKEDLPLEKLLGKELGTVYGNQARYWSITKEKLAECTITGTLYQLNGFDEDFRVCLYFEEPANADTGQESTYYLYVFERTNNLTLCIGKDYYADLLHFPEDATLNNLDMKDEEVAAFVDALLEATFIDPHGKDAPIFDYTTEDHAYYVIFTDSLGIRNSFEIYEDGYVVAKKDHNFILKLEPSLCQTIIDKIHQPEWGGNYLYTTYTYDKDSNTRTQYYYRLDVTETDTHLTFDILVEENHVPLIEGGCATVFVGPAGSVTFSKEEISQEHVLSFSIQPHPEEAPELISYVELQKGHQEEFISLRYADSKEELAKKEFITLNKQ